MKETLQYAIGFWPVLEAIKNGQEIEKVLIQKGLQHDQLQELFSLLRARQIPYQVVPPEKLNRVTRKNHQGVIATISPIVYQNLEDIVPAIFEEGNSPLILILDRVTDVRNFGAICRTALCAGAHCVVIPGRGSAQINEDAIKTSAGALLSLPICRVENIKDSIHFLKASGIKIVACTEKTENTIYQEDFSPPTAILMGSEEDGISKAYLKLADASASIPMSGKLDSLNVSVATGIILFEVIRQRLNF